MIAKSKSTNKEAIKKSMDKVGSRSSMKQGRNTMPSDSYVDGLKLGPDGLYRYRIMVNGKVRTGNTGMRGILQAKNELVNIRASFQQESLGTLKKKAPTFSKAIEIYAEKKKGLVTEQYITNNVNILRLHFEKKLGSIFIDKITKDNLSDCLQAYLSTTQYGKAVKNYGGYNQILIILHSFFDVMKSQNYVKSYEIPERITGQRKIKRKITQEQFNQLLNIIDTKFSIEYSVAIRLGLFLGLRSVEIVKAKWSMIDWVNSVWRNDDTKGRESSGIPIPDEVIEWLKKIKEKKGLHPSGYILVDKRGRQFPREFMRYHLQVAGRQILGQYMSSHDLRRSYINALHEKGVPIGTIQQCARHSHIKTTLEYIEVTMEDKKRAIQQTFGKLD